MVATKDDAIDGELNRGRNLFHELAEILGRHAGIATLLVNLIAGCFKQDSLIVLRRTQQRSFNDQRMG